MKLRQRQRIVGVLVDVLTRPRIALLIQGRPDWQDELAKWLMKLGYPSPMDAFFPLDWAARVSAQAPSARSTSLPLIPRVARGDLLVAGSGPLTAEVLVPPGQIGVVLFAGDGATEEEFLLAAKDAHARIRDARRQQDADQQRALLARSRAGLSLTSSAGAAAAPQERAFTRAVNRHLRERVEELEQRGPRLSREAAPQRVFRELWLLRDFFERGAHERKIADTSVAWENLTARWLKNEVANGDTVNREAWTEWRRKRQGTVVPEHMRPADVRDALRRWLGPYLGRNPHIVRDSLAIGGWRVLCRRDERRYFVGKIAGGSVCQADWPDDVDRAFHEMHFAERIRTGQRLRRTVPARLRRKAQVIRAAARVRATEDVHGEVTS